MEYVLLQLYFRVAMLHWVQSLSPEGSCCTDSQVYCPLFCRWTRKMLWRWATNRWSIQSDTGATGSSSKWWQLAGIWTLMTRLGRKVSLLSSLSLFLPPCCSALQHAASRINVWLVGVNPQSGSLLTLQTRTGFKYYLKWLQILHRCLTNR